MPNTKQNEKNWVAAREAFASMERNCLHPSANNFAVWLSYHSRNNDPLCVEIDTAIAQGKAIDDFFCANAFQTYLDNNELSDKLLSAGGSFENEMHDMLHNFEDVRQDANRFKTSLDSAKQRIEVASNDPHILKNVVDDLSSATNQMMSRSVELEERIKRSHKEIAGLRIALENARSEASKDSLTGVANRKSFDEFLLNCLEDARLTRKPVSIIMADIDHFKRVNDRWGHQTGDQVICYVAGVLQNEAPKNGIVARLGGEEFAIIAPDTDARSARDLAEKIRKTVEKKKLIRRNSKEDLGQITLSAGVAQHERNEKTSDWIERVDMALYASKNNGRNRTTIATANAAKAA